MVTRLTNSELSTSLTHSTHSHKAWHLFSLLLTLGRPASPSELASNCKLFAASPNFVEFLCSIPDSPIFLTANRLVTLSFNALIAFGEFLSNSNLIVSFMPQFDVGDFGQNVIQSRKRERGRLDCEFDEPLFTSVKRNRVACKEVGFHIADNISKSLITHPSDRSVMLFDLGKLNKVVARTPLLFDSNVGLLHHGWQNIKPRRGEMDTSTILHRKVQRNIYRRQLPDRILIPHIVARERLMACDLDTETTLQTSLLRTPAVQNEATMSATNFQSRIDYHGAISVLEVDQQRNISPQEAGTHNFASEVASVRLIRSDGDVKCKEEVPLIDYGTSQLVMESSALPYITAQLDMPPENDFKRMKTVHCNDVIPSFDREPAERWEKQATCQAAELSVELDSLKKSSSEMKTRDLSAIRQQSHCKSLDYNKPAKGLKEQHKHKRDHKSISTNQKLNQSRYNNVYIRERRKNSVANPPKEQLETKLLPDFESFVVEEEEGSGGYGTVYKARRKFDGMTFAIKCPHPNAHRIHVTNELRMLERFGGKNFVIKFEGSFKSGNSDCFILEHVEHDRPEVLKREIDVFQLQWYGYCMFRALASLHKQGIVHRDVKPGNFLFSRKLNKGYLIDFNLAMDLNQKYGTINKSKAGYDEGNRVPPHGKSLPPTRSKNVMHTKFPEALSSKAARASKSTTELKNPKNKVASQMTGYELGSRNTMMSQGADGSGITSAKDVTSTRTPSAERLREPVPCQGRKELISLVQEALHVPNHEAASVPASKRKRIAAPRGKVDREVVYPSPMPLHWTGGDVGHAGLLKNKGDKKQNREGPCVGTKGFRAPEVLFRSQHQGPKVDVWSAGVTLLYLMIGKTPFVGDPDQNIKEIAKVRGSEDLWEVAKLHNRESSFPEDLFDMQYLPSVKLRDWCESSTKRPNFLQKIPRSLFDLVDRCLTVNPRLRISAEEALRHEFFAQCHESLRKQRLLRQGLNSNTSLSHGQNVVRPLEVSQLAKV